MIIESAAIAGSVAKREEICSNQNSKSSSQIFRGDLTINKDITSVSCIDKDFEDGSVYPWIDDSTDGVSWVIQESSSILEVNNNKHLRIKPSPESNFGVAILRSPTFIATPGDVVTFSYRIRSKYQKFNNLQVY